MSLARRALFLVATVLLTAAVRPHAMRADESLRVTVYHSPTCDHCTEFLQQIWPDLEASYGDRITVALVDISTPDGLAALEAHEERLGQRAPDIPVVVVGDVLLFDLDMARLGRRVAEALDVRLAGGSADAGQAPGGAVPPDGPAGDDGGAIIHLAYVTKEGCSECDRASIVLGVVQQDYPQLRVTTLDLLREAALVEAMGAHVGLPESQRLVAPAVYVGADVLQPDEIDSARVRELIGRYTAGGAPAFWEDLETSGGRASIVSRFQRMGPVAVMVAGLVDGLNPCAFATILFFVSYLAISRRTRSQLLATGLAFSAGVFTTYLVVGLGAMRLLELATALRHVGPALNGVMALGCLLLAGLSLRDYFLARRGRLHEMSLNLPDGLRERIKGRIRASGGAVAGAALLTGAVVSLLELACTGQVYLPTISFVVGLPELRTSAIVYLLLYNLFFVTPLLVILVMAVYGVSAARLQDWFVRNAAGAKLLMTGLFVLLGGLLAVQAVGV